MRLLSFKRAWRGDLLRDGRMAEEEALLSPASNGDPFARVCETAYDSGRARFTNPGKFRRYPVARKSGCSASHLSASETSVRVPWLKV